MPNLIVTETCPAPECNLLPEEVESFVTELQTYHALFKTAFRRRDQLAWRPNTVVRWARSLMGR